MRRAVGTIFSKRRGRAYTCRGDRAPRLGRQTPGSDRAGILRHGTCDFSLHSARGIRRPLAARAQLQGRRFGRHGDCRAISRRPKSSRGQIRRTSLRLGHEALNKMTTTLKPPAPASADKKRQEQWVELRSVFPIYLALARQLKIAIPFSPEKRNLP